MKDKELAKKLEQFGAEDCGNYRWIDAGVIDSLPIDEFVRDWRVAGALMTRCRTVNYSTTTTKGSFCHAHGKNDKHGANNAANGEEARAIIEACVEALDDL